MVAFKSPLKPSVSASKSAAFPIQTPCRDLNRLACLNFGFRSALVLNNTLYLDRIKKDLVRKMGGGGRFNGCSVLRRKPEIDTVSGGDNVVDAAAETKLVPDHLVVMVNGIIGSAEDWRYAAEQFAKKLSDRVVVYCSECNPSKLTFDGVDSMGERLANEVLDVARCRPKVRKISFVAHSLGGLVARYAIGRLYSQHVISVDTTKKFSCKEGASTIMDCPQQPHGDRIAGLEPMNFITFATPHLGSSGHNQVPMLFGLPFLERGASQTAHLIVGRSGKHLFLTDNDEGRRPLLLRMVNDNEDIKFMSALRSFKRRVAYANANYDYVVGWRTSSIRRQWELPKFHLIAKDERYPHIVSVEREFEVNTHSVASHVVSDQSADFEEEMIRGLTQVPWERVDVSFQSSKQRYVAHNTIQVKTYWLNSDGADVVFHMIDSFLL